MKVSLFFGSSAYAMLRGSFGAMDIRLEPGRKASIALKEYSAEQESRAAAILEKAKLAKEAAAILESEGK